MNSIPTLPTFTDLSLCSRPIPKIFTEVDITNWIDSQAFHSIQILIQRLNYAVHGLKVEQECTESETVKKIVSLLDGMTNWVDEILLDTTPQRFGNKSFRIWIQKMKDNTVDPLLRIVPPSLSPILPELTHHFQTCFGSSSRLDYGTGHELSFLAFLLILRMVGILREEDELAMVTRIFVSYLNLVRKLQYVYKLEPAGSKGVWGLDDHQHLNYLFGASQLKDHPTLTPSSILDPSTITPSSNSYLFLSSILHIRQLKSGPFAEHSPVLYNIASTVPNWSKVNSGLIKMYEMEVLRKVPVIQHFWFGGILSWRNQSNEGQMSSSGDGKELIEVEDQKIVEENNNLQSTKVPWSVLPNSATTSRSGPTLQNRTQAPWSAIGVPRSFTPPEPFSRNGRN